MNKSVVEERAKSALDKGNSLCKYPIALERESLAGTDTGGRQRGVKSQEALFTPSHTDLPSSDSCWSAGTALSPGQCLLPLRCSEGQGGGERYSPLP